MAPGTASDAFAVLVMVRAGVSTVTLTVQRGSVLPGGQLLPAAVVMSVAVSTVFRGTVLSTVTLPLMVTVPPTGMLPVHETLVVVTVSVPEVAVWSPLGGRCSVGWRWARPAWCGNLAV